MSSRIVLSIAIVCTGCSKAPDEPTVARAPVSQKGAVDIKPQPGKEAESTLILPSIANAPLDPVKKRVASRFEKWFGEIQQHDTMPIAKAQVAWRESWLASYNKTLASGSNPRVQDGAENPSELIEAKPPVKPYIMQVAEGKFDLASNEEELESMMCLHMLLAGVMLQGGYELPDLLGDRFDAAPPNRGDVITFQMVQDAVKLRERRGRPITPDESAAWERMSQARNPVYRQLALLIYPRIAATNEAVLKFLESRSVETDSQNFLLMVSNVAALPDGIGFEYLKSLQAGNTAKSHPGAATAIAAALEDLEQRRRR